MRRLITSAVLTATVASVGLGLASTSSFGAKASRPHHAAAARQSRLVTDVAAGRLATAKYVTNLARAKADGYGIITRMIPTMGYHFLNPKVSGFNVRKPPILVYEHHGKRWQLGALEWVFTSKPAKPPLPGAQYGSFPAACHYMDGTFVAEASQSQCPATSPQTGAKFNFWHPDLITLHFWIWYPNPAGIYSGMNPMVKPFNNG
ncbi:MAG TPA: hypothetical protein VFU61_01575 [Steroidobacteraceae bacterium]|nr:hypothetical protein [Steroidobacteraceae bacterium]